MHGQPGHSAVVVGLKELRVLEFSDLCSRGNLMLDKTEEWHTKSWAQ